MDEVQMTIHGIVDFILDHWAITSLIVTSIIEVTPIFKCNPITALFRWIGRKMTAEVMTEVKNLDKLVKEQGKDIQRNEMDRIRWEVLDFANSCRNGRKHTKNEFAHIIDLNKKYEALLERPARKTVYSKRTMPM